MLTGICTVILKSLTHNTCEILLDTGVCDLQSKLPPNVFKGFPCGKESTCNVGDLGSIRALGRSPGEEKGYPLQCSGLCHKESDSIGPVMTPSPNPFGWV